MEAVLWKAIAFLFIIALGYTLKRLHVFEEKDYKVITKIVMNITLPAAIITSFSSYQVSPELFLMTLLGFGCTFLLLVIGYLFTCKRDGKTQVHYMLNLSGYNIGCFTLPYMQSFFGPLGVVATCMFDAGNCLLSTGGSYAIVSNLVEPGCSPADSLKHFLKKLFSSMPFDASVLMATISLCGFRLPDAAVTISSTISSANGFLAMLMIGTMFKLDRKPEYLKKAGITLLVRYSAAAVFAILFYFYIPLPLELRQVLVILVFSPISALSPVFTGWCKGDLGLASFVNSLSIMVSVVIITFLILAMSV